MGAIAQMWRGRVLGNIKSQLYWAEKKRNTKPYEEMRYKYDKGGILIKEKIETLLLVGLSVGISLLDLLGLLDNIPWLAGRIPTLTLLFVGLLVGYFLLERKKLDEMEYLLKNQIPSRVYNSDKEFYEDAMFLIKNCKNSDIIKATALTLTAPYEKQEYRIQYFQTIAKRIKIAKEHSGSLLYRVVIGKKQPSQAKNRVQTRQEFFSSENVTDRLQTGLLNMEWPIDFLIIGDSVLVGFESCTCDLAYRVGFKVTDKHLTSSVSQWYDDVLWNKAEKELVHESSGSPQSIRALTT